MFLEKNYIAYEQFFTPNEYKSYCRCVNKISVGDVVYIFTNRYGLSATSTETNVPLTVIGINKRHKLLLGSATQIYGFWTRKRFQAEIDGLEQIIKDTEKYPFGWWLCSVLDGRIAKIESQDQKLL